MKPSVWGPHGWIFLHSITMAYPEDPSDEDKRRMINFFESVKYVLPCTTCSNNLRKHMSSIPLTEKALSSQKNLMKWLVNIHNKVNDETGKPRMSHSDAIEEMESWYSE